ncbi:MAG: hypothetical protein IT204_16300 [Fimbriimonadaceae bacterium]|nr:hypothetical protein [Fimbriimonadaceae bacterium]
MRKLFPLVSEPANLVTAAVATPQAFEWRPLLPAGDAPPAARALDEALAAPALLPPGPLGVPPSGPEARAAKSAGYGIDEIVEEAEAILKDAQDEAARVVQAARREAAAERDRIYAECLAQARSEAQSSDDPERRAALDELDVAAEEVRTAAAVFNNLADQIKMACEQQLEALEQKLAEAVWGLAQQAIEREVTAHPEIVEDAVRRAVALQPVGEVTVRVHPADLPRVQGLLLEIQSHRNTGDMIEFEGDPNVERGGCVAVGTRGRIDEQPSATLQHLREQARE